MTEIFTVFFTDVEKLEEENTIVGWSHEKTRFSDETGN